MQGRGEGESVKVLPASDTQTLPLPAPPKALKSHPGFVVFPEGLGRLEPEYKGSQPEVAGDCTEPRVQQQRLHRLKFRSLDSAAAVVQSDLFFFF